MKSLSSKTYQCGVTIQGLTTLSGTVYLTGITNTASWDHVIVGTTAQGQIYTRTYAQFMGDVATGINLSGYVPTSRTLTINGTGYDLSADRSWTITTPFVSKLQHQVKAGVAINKGQAVYVTGADGTNMIVGLASNVSEATSSKTMGLLDATVSTNGFANVVTEGLLAGLDTTGATAAGDPVWLGTGGNLIYGLASKPYAPAHLVFIGIVTRRNANNGEIFVKVQNGFELKEIHDVDLFTTTPVNGHILGFDGTLWVNKTVASWLGYTPANASGTTNYISKFTGSTTLGNSQVFDNGTNVGIGTATPGYKLEVDGTTKITGDLTTSNIYPVSGNPSIGTAGSSFGTAFMFNLRSSIDLTLGSGFSGSGDKGLTMFASTRNIVIQNGGTFTDNGYRLDVNGNTKLRNATYFGVISQPAAPTLVTNSTSGGTLAADTYTYRISAIDSNNAETTPSNTLVVTTTGSTSSVSMSWPLVQAAYSYRIYRTNSGGTTVYYTNSGTNSVTFTDTGAAGTVGTTASVNNTAYGYFAGNGDFRSGNITIQNNGIGNTSTILFAKSTDVTSINVVEYSNDNTMFEFSLADNPDGGGDFFHWVLPDWQNASSGWKPLKFSNFTTQIVGQSSNFWSSFSLPSSTPYYTTNQGSLANASIKWDPYTSTSYNLPKDNSGGGTGNLNVDVTGVSSGISGGFTNSSNTIYWITIQAGATTFNWGYGSYGSTAVGTGIAITGAWQTLSNGVAIRITGAVTANDRWAFRAFPVPKMGIGTTTPIAPLQLSTTVTPTSAVARGVLFNPTLVATANSDVLVGLDVAPTFNNGAFTGIRNVAIRTSGGIVPSTSAGASLGEPSFNFNQLHVRQIQSSGSSGFEFYPSYTTKSAQWFTTGNLLLQNGGTFTDAGYKLDVTGTLRTTDSAYFATTSGSVGIGTTSPTSKLEVAGNILATEGTIYSYKTSGEAVISASYAGNQMYMFNNSSWYGLYSTDYGTLFLRTKSTGLLNIYDKIYATTSGNVGIGTSSPNVTLEANGKVRSTRSGVASQYLEIDGGTAGAVYLIAAGASKPLVIKNNNTTQSEIWFDQAVASHYLWLQAGTEKMRLNSSGNLGIGTTTPATLLDVSGVITATGGNSTNWNTAYGWGNHASASYVPQARTLTINGTSYDLSANRSWTIATTTAAGSDTQVQYNSSGSLAGASALTYNSTTNRVGINQASPGYDLDVNGQVRVQDKLRVGTVNSGNGVVHMSSTATINASATTIVWSQNVSVGMCAFIEYYILNSNTGTDQRAGTIIVTWNQSGTPTIAHTETTTPDIGSTVTVNFTSSLVGSDARINAVSSSPHPYTMIMSYKYF